MKILLIFHERNIGGACRCGLTTAEELRARGHEVFAVLPFRFGNLYPAVRALGIPYKTVFFGWWMMPKYWNPLLKTAFRLLHFLDGIAVGRIARLIRRERISLVHSNSGVIDVGARAARRTHTPHIWHIREFGDADYSLEYLLGRERSLAYMRDQQGKLLFVSHTLREHFRADFPDDICEVIYDGISRDYLHPKERESVDNPIVFLIAGNLQEGKGQIQALEAVSILKERGVSGFQLLIAGAATAMRRSKEYVAQLQRKAESIPDGTVRFLGFVDDMKALRARTDVELVCSACEAYGRVTIEAMMSSNPVIASDVGANPELISDGETGLLYPYGDASALADCMERLIRDPRLIARMGAAACTYAEECHCSEAGTEAMEALYSKVL